MIDIFGVNWDYPENELCSVCGQPDSCGDCNHFQLNNEEVKQIKGFEQYIIVDFSGWIKISPEKVNFVNIGSEEEKVISGAEWMKLNEDERGDYVLEDVIAAQRDCYDGSYDDISFTGYIEDEKETYMRGLDKYKKILVDVIDLYHEIKSQPHTSNPFIAYYGEVDKELVDLFIKWYRKELGDAIYDVAIPMLIDEHGKAYDFLSYSYNNGWILEFDGSKYGESDLTVKVLDKKGPLK